MEILLTLAYSFLFIWLITRLHFFQIDGIPRLWLIAVFLLKVLSGVFFWYIYTYYYPVRNQADIYKYFDDSKIMFDALHQHPSDFFKMLFGFDSAPYLYDEYYSKMQLWSPRFKHAVNLENHTMIRLSVLFRLFSMGFYQVHNVFINALSFAGLVALYKAFVGYATGKNKLLFIAIFLVPTVLFWGSGVIRESFILFAMGFTIYYWNRLTAEQGNAKNIIAFIVFILLLFVIKITLCVLIISGCAAWYLSIHIRRWPVAVNFVLLTFLGFSAVAALAKFTSHNYFNTYVTKQIDFINISNGGLYLLNSNKMIYIPYVKREKLLEQVGDSIYKVRPGSDYYYYNMPNSADTNYVYNSTDTLTYKLFSATVPAKSMIRIPLLSATPWSFIKNSPTAFVNVFARPSVFESFDPFTLIAALENEAVLLLLIITLMLINRSAFNEPALWFCLFLVTGFYVMIGWVTPILGAIVRYKAVVFPFLMIALVLLFDHTKKFKLR
ncbi:MAG: hypothetical protein HYU69_06180 [Bacteroidetes bacterium]|nr:hypothetical protein [Bacteroidota bacterium]